MIVLGPVKKLQPNRMSHRAGSRNLDLDLGADFKAHRTPGEEHNGFPDDSAYRPAKG